MKEGGAIYQARQAENKEAYQFKENQAQRAHEFAENNAQRAADRELNRQLAGDKLKLAELDREVARDDLRFRRETARQDRRSQQMMMLIKGLSQLGAGFAL